MIMNMSALIVSLMMPLLAKAKNPLKVSFIMLILTNTMFFKLAFISGSTWMPLLFMLLFTGGILLMFMMLSSVMPNQKSKKTKPKKTMMILMTFIIIISSTIHMSKETEMMNQMKSFLTSGLNMTWMTTLILIYFLSSMKYMSTEQMPLRSNQCCKKI